MDKIILSICIPVYNQIGIVRECVNRIIVSKSTEFEVVISDDCSREPIESMVQNINDKRVKYYRNDKNLGHDRNILAAFSRARGKYAFLLRTRDYIIPTGIENIISFLETREGISYLTTSAYDSANLPKLVYNDQIYQKGIEAIKAHNKLYIHPSGSVYNLTMFDPDRIRDFLDSVEATSRNFTVHSLIRLLLATKGNFATCHFYSWIYSDTTEAQDVAMNRNRNKESVYATSCQLERYYTEMLWADKILNKEWKTEQYLWLFSTYLYAVTWANKAIYCDRRLRRHYDFCFRKIDCKTERDIFLEYAEGIEKNLNIHCDEYMDNKKKIIFRNKTTDALRYAFMRLKIEIPFKGELKRIIYGIFNLRKVI